MGDRSAVPITNQKLGNRGGQALPEELSWALSILSAVRNRTTPEATENTNELKKNSFDSVAVQKPTFIEALGFWFKLGFISFDGPTGEIAIMHAEFVEKRRWISEERFLHALNFCMLLPGAEAQQPRQRRSLSTM